MQGFFEGLADGFKAEGRFAAKAIDYIVNTGLEFALSNPNFRESGVQQGVNSLFLESYGSPMMRLGAYENQSEPLAADVSLVNAAWDLGAAATVYRDLGVREPTAQLTSSGRTTTDFIGNATVTSFGKIVGTGTIDVRSTIEGIENGIIPSRRTFYNNRGDLPLQIDGYYKEYILPTPGVNGVGSQRIIRGAGGEYYYTPDHYDSFVPLN